MQTRREFVMRAGLAGAAWIAAGRWPAAAADDLWDEAAAILRRIVPPTFPDRRFDITRYGATAGGGDATRAFREAIAACRAAGGGQVVVPAGRFETGPIVLRSNVNL